MGKGGALDCWGKCMKIFLICINVFAILGGLLVLGVGIWVWASLKDSVSLVNCRLFVIMMAIVLMMGVFVVIISVVGLYGACMEVKFKLMMYCVLIFIIFLGMFVGGILQFVFRDHIRTTLNKSMYSTIPKYSTTESITNAWDNTQTYLQCCGVQSYKDWEGKVPESCCKKDTLGKRIDCMSSPLPTTTYMQGCFSKTLDVLRKDASYVGAVALIVAFIMLTALILACGLLFKIK